MQSQRTGKIVMTALFAALCCVATMVIRIPSPTGGYINPGDAIVLLGALILGPMYGAVAGGLGSAMADALAGYMAYVPATLIIKAAMGLCAGFIFKKLHTRFSIILAGVAAEVIMIAGYFVFTAVVLGLGWGALPEIAGNCVQGLFGIIASSLLYKALAKTKYVKSMM